MTGRGLTVFWLSALLVGTLLAVLFGGCDAQAQTPFGYRYVGTVKWVPSTDNNELSTAANFGQVIQCVTLRSTADWRMFIMTGDYLANAELMNASLSATQLDSLYDLGFLCPAEGVVYYGHLPWLVAPASTDTILVDGYVEE